MNDAELLATIGRFSNNELEIFKNHRQIKSFKKGQQLLSVGEVCRAIYFLKTGAVLQYKPKNETEKVYSNLYVENEWVMNHKSFVSQGPSDSCIEAFTDCDVVAITLYAFHSLIERSQNFLQFARLLNAVTDRLEFFDQGYTPAEKYNHLVQHKPKVIQTFPLKIIASYLKITPETLSRIRSNR